MLPPQRVLSEMESLGLPATELGPIGYLPLEGEPLRAMLAAHGLRLVGGFVPLVLHSGAPRAAGDDLEQILRSLAAAGAEVLVAAVVMDADWSPPQGLDRSQWSRLAAGLEETAQKASEHGLRLALHPHAGTLVESEADIEHVLASSDVSWCLDTGHLAIAGVDSAAFVRSHCDRIVHVHLKDVDLGLARDVGRHRLSLLEATRRGLFLPLGQGGAEIERVVRALDQCCYDGWLVLEQDTAISGEEPAAGSGPILDVRRSIEFLRALAPSGEESRQTREVETR